MTNTYAIQDNSSPERCESRSLSSQPCGIVEAARTMSDPAYKISAESNGEGNGVLAKLGLPTFSQLFGDSNSNPGADTTCGVPPASNSGDQSINIPIGDSGRTVQSNSDGSAASTTVQPGDSLYNISKDLLGGDSANADPTSIMNLALQIADKNNISSPYTIYPGETLNLPDATNIPTIANALGDQPACQLPSACPDSSSVTPASLEQQVKQDIGNGSDEQAYRDLESNMSNLSGQDQETLKGMLKGDNLIPALAAGAVQNSLDQSGNSSFSYDDALAMSKDTPVDKALALYTQNNFSTMAGDSSWFADPANDQITSGSLSTFEGNQAANTNLPDQTVSSLEQQLKADVTQGSYQQAFTDLEQNSSGLSAQDQASLQTQLQNDGLIPDLSIGAVQSSMIQSGDSSFSYNDALNLSTDTAVDQSIAKYVQNNFSDMAGGTEFSAPQFEQITSDSLTAFAASQQGQGS